MMIRYKSIVIILVICAILCGCSPGVDNSVVEFVKETKNRKIEYKGELPKFPPIVPFKYTASNLRDPFTAFVVNSAEKNTAYQGGGPDLHRPREPLESYPLDSLQMVGTLERQGMFFALLKDTAGIVHRASIGNYIGQNSGKIVKINQNMVEIQQWMPDGKGGWREQWAKILLVIPSNKTKGV